MTYFQKALNEFAKSFTTIVLDNGHERVVRKDDTPEWVQGVVYQCHDDMLPDDWRYYMIERMALSLSEQNPDDMENAQDEIMEISGNLVSVGYFELAEWLSSHTDRFSYCDDVLLDLGLSGMFSVLQSAQTSEYEEIGRTLACALETVADEMETEELD